MRLRDEAGADQDRDPVAVVGAALDAGVSLLDTADLYRTSRWSGGRSMVVATR